MLLNLTKIMCRTRKKIRLFNDNMLRNNLIDKGFKRLKNFSWEKCANETIKVYKKVVE